MVVFTDEIHSKIKMFIATNNWEEETYKKKLEKIVKMERATVLFSRTTKVRLS